MADTNKDFMARLADRGEQVVGRITDLPGAKAAMDRMTALTKQLNETQRRLRALDPLEERVTALEKRVKQLEGKGPAAKRTTSRKPASTPKRASSSSGSARKPSGSSS